MMATWFQGPADEFIRVSQEGLRSAASASCTSSAAPRSRSRATRDRADQDDDLAARRRCTASLCDVVCTGRFYDFLNARRPLGHRAAPADLREGPDRPGRPGARAGARSGAARPVSRGLPAPGLPPDADRLQGQARHAGPDRSRGRGALSARRRLARRGRARRPAAQPGTDPLDAKAEALVHEFVESVRVGRCEIPKSLRSPAHEIRGVKERPTLFGGQFPFEDPVDRPRSK